jgi:hypothetical protein
MPTTREKIVARARSWIGCKESDGSHKQIIDVYNADKPLPRGYKVSYTDAWCATFVTACAIKCGATDIIPKECSCNKMIELFKGLGCWVENDAHLPSPGDLIFYDWDDSGKDDNKGQSDHVGIVESVSGNNVTVIEGNYNNACKRRLLNVNGKYIRGYGVPKYDEVPAPVVAKVSISLPVLRRGDKGGYVKLLQHLLDIHGYTDPNKKPLEIDGSFGPATQYALATFQSYEKLKADCVCGAESWSALCKIE